MAMMDNGRIRAVAVLGLAVLLGLIASSVGKRDRNEILDEQFCQVYYTLPSGECSELRSRVRSEVRGNGTPTLELGNKDTQPAMVFLHGWPDTSAVWANQFAEFCGEDNEYFCVAPSWIDFHPDYPPAKQPTLYSRQRRDFLAVIEDLGLRDITFVVFDFGSILGYQMLHLYPDLFNKVISIDIPMRVGIPIAPYPDLKEHLPTYQQNNIEAFLSNDNDIMTQNMVTLVWAAPCIGCKIAPSEGGVQAKPHAASGIGARTGWPYYNFVRMDEPWTSDGFDVPVEDWKFSFAPTFPSSTPLLYLWNTEGFQQPSWFQWIEQRADGSQHTQINLKNTDHWMQVRHPVAVNSEISEWLASVKSINGTGQTSSS
jgi:pimeloyl-ACP methyl ester carboxylesterase